MEIKTYIVDAFTNEPFKGNPAGVCLIEEEIEAHLMLSIAQELGLSETAFVRRMADDHFSIRFFSPKMEIPLCGHATLASSKVLFERFPALQKIQFSNIQKLDLVITKEGNDIVMQFPVYDTKPSTFPDALRHALGIQSITNCEYNKEFKVLVLEIDDSEVLGNLKPDFEALCKSHTGINGVVVTTLSNRRDFDFESRYFWPWSGTNEDPVTGGTHTFLTKYWSKKLGKKKMRSYQCSQRSGHMEVALIDDKKMTIKSNAHIILNGAIKMQSVNHDN
ncbi:MAG: Phenazine biosynthesis protein PhzF [Flaviaesturariibacter sp.]|nr:Phenazine biosynthesis protein PhzF [Flaviaesturariibacter sp.]